MDKICATCKHSEYWHYGACICTERREMVDPVDTCDKHEDANRWQIREHKERDCNLCLWATRDGGCASWECEFVSKADAYEAYQMMQKPSKMIEYLRQTSMKEKNERFD